MHEKLFFQCGVDCEPLMDKSPACGGPGSWEISEKAILKYLDIFKAKRILPALAFNLTPEAAKAHADLFKQLKKEGIEIGIQPNVPGFRFPSYKFDLGYYDKGTQRKIIREALEDFKKAVGFLPEVYTACCGSRNEYTYSLLIEFGLKVQRIPVSGRYNSNRADICTIGGFPYPHWASNHPVIPGCLPLYVIPITGDITGLGRDKWIFDLRPENPPTHETLARYRQVVDMNIEVMKLIKAPVKAIVVGTHNTEYVHFENLEYVIDYVKEKVEKVGMEFIPASCIKMREFAEEMGGPGKYY
jgi:peptidoglycan/xylan/chitin deacetylase (PgdA/CDA1 family)